MASINAGMSPGFATSMLILLHFMHLSQNTLICLTAVPHRLLWLMRSRVSLLMHEMPCNNKMKKAWHNFRNRYSKYKWLQGTDCRKSEAVWLLQTYNLHFTGDCTSRSTKLLLLQSVRMKIAQITCYCTHG